MADRNRAQGGKRKDKKADNKSLEEKTKEKTGKKVEKIPKQPAKVEEEEKGEAEKKKKEEAGGGDGGGGGEAAAGAETTDGDFQPMELPPFEIVTGWVSRSTQTPPFSASPWLPAP